MSDGERLKITIGSVKCCFRYLFAVFQDHLLTKNTFSSLKLNFSDSNCSPIFSVQHFCSTLKTMRQNTVNYESLVFISVKIVSNKYPNM